MTRTHLTDSDTSTAVQQQVLEALRYLTPLTIVGGGSKSFLGRTTGRAQPVEIGKHRGIVEYDPRELVLTARSGTPLSEIEAALADANQMLAFEPPHFGRTARRSAVRSPAACPARAVHTAEPRAISCWAAKC